MKTKEGQMLRVVGSNPSGRAQLLGEGDVVFDGVADEKESRTLILILFLMRLGYRGRQMMRLAGDDDDDEDGKRGREDQGAAEEGSNLC